MLLFNSQKQNIYIILHLFANIYIYILNYIYSRFSWCSSMESFCCVTGSFMAGGRIYTAGLQGRSGRRRISAAGSLAPELKFQGENHKYYYSNYQLFSI